MIVTYVTQHFFDSQNYSTLCKTANLLDQFIQEGASVCKGDIEQPVADFGVALDWLLAEAKRGVSIQRYKGLGEMNAVQLWETTMDPSVRRLLKVKIEDVIAADDVFTTLMGDNVEPRRAFIEHNALFVDNIDI
jgi:DNA gyrase subunit B